MTTDLATLAAEREALLQRSALCRLRLERDAHGVRHSLPSVLKYAVFAGRILLVVRAARSVFGFLRGR